MREITCVGNVCSNDSCVIPPGKGYPCNPYVMPFILIRLRLTPSALSYTARCVFTNAPHPRYKLTRKPLYIDENTNYCLLNVMHFYLVIITEERNSDTSADSPCWGELPGPALTHREMCELKKAQAPLNLKSDLKAHLPSCVCAVHPVV